MDLSAALEAKKSNLKPTTTVVRHLYGVGDAAAAKAAGKAFAATESGAKTREITKLSISASLVMLIVTSNFRIPCPKRDLGAPCPKRSNAA